jgi:hypothetical protein
MPVSPVASDATTTCPSCGAAASGRFCASCGAPLAGAACAACGSALSPGAKFCHRCGTAVGSAGAVARRPDEARGGAAALPWAVASIALLALIALVAGQRFNAPRGSSLDAPSNALPQVGLDDRGSASGAGPVAGQLPPDGAPPRAPDISQMSPAERASRLFDRVIGLSERGRTDSVQFFAPMALTAYQMLGTLDLDQRYDLGRIGEVSGAPELARAQADTILRQSPTHLLGLTLAASAAEMRGDTRARRDYHQRLLAAERSELAKNLPEYQAHRVDIDTALARARRE